MTSRDSGSLVDVARKRRPQEAGETLWRNLLGALLRVVGAAAMCGVSVALIDRPVATWIHEHLGYQCGDRDHPVAGLA